ncbi:MAG: hypothetical protein ACK5KN_13315 [Dysgonomonas sp.]|jgi:hypothetical protein|uniref:hypothetical protein n=1 Tax=Dysgonomonas sp. TaxID=1891233 RepID=UPI00282AE633|nr:hypothetical protein [Prevotella sp.]
MSKTAIYPICLISMIASAIFYQFKGNPRDKYKNNIEVLAQSIERPEHQSSTLTAYNDAVPTILSVMAIARPLLTGQEPFSVSLDNGIWYISGTKGDIVKVSKETGEVLDTPERK